MKKYLKKFKKLPKDSILSIINDIIEHRLFKPISIAIIASFTLFHSFTYVRGLILDYRESRVIKAHASPIKINVAGPGIDFDIKEDQVIEYRVRPNDTMLKILMDIGVDEADIFTILGATKKLYDPKSIAVNDNIIIKYKLKIGYDANKPKGKDVERKVIVNNLHIFPAIEKEIIVSRQKDGEYKAKENIIKLNRQVSKYLGTINEGLFVDGVASGISPGTVMNIINLYSYDVDFQRDIHNGDKFEVLVESFYDQNGKKIKDGAILFSSLTLNNRAIEIYAHKMDNRTEYFDSKGNSTRKSLLRTPINGARISSGFGMRRHPVLGYSRLHKGIDFAAPSGTPIYAAGSGTISYYGIKGGYGNFVQIKHNSEYSTAYGHASRFVKKMRVGSKVKQGDVVAYVGSTGRSTGPHLHFEVMYRGSAINPAKVKATSGLRLSGKELIKFKNSKSEIDRYRKNIPNQVKG